MTEADHQAVSACLSDATRYLTNAQTVQRLSRDFYWYSPVLKALLDDKTAEAVVQPTSIDEVIAVLGCCHVHHVPVTARGAGTGNYGQAIPLYGGIVLDLSRMDAIETITGDGIAITGPGTRLGVLETEARTQGWELRCYPSTIAKASVGGFLGGGSGGIGSISHGGLRDFETVRFIDVVTMEPKPRLVRHSGEQVHEVLHAWGTNGIIVRVGLALTPAVDWSQCAIAFPTFAAAYDFSERIAQEKTWTKRLVTTFEWPIPSAFAPILSLTRPGEALVFIMIATIHLENLMIAAQAAGGEVTHAGPYIGLRTQPLLSDYTWNHTTLWAMKLDPEYTYLQCGFSPSEVRAQFAQLKQKYGEDFLLHIEFMKVVREGEPTIIPASIPVIRFTSETRLNEMIDFCRSIGVSVANPHSNNVEGGGRYRPDNIQLMTKHKYDPQNLLNPGKMVTFKP